MIEAYTSVQIPMSKGWGSVWPEGLGTLAHSIALKSLKIVEGKSVIGPATTETSALDERTNPKSNKILSVPPPSAGT